ncbi:hypothetical protein [Buttiauxella agrestis]|uniref:hypothetical protein n=1 Tax=Buttiauxella agrestis TaxID=82977 RepID=UPI00351BBDED
MFLGGSSGFTPELIHGFIKRHAELPISKFRLRDIETGCAMQKVFGVTHLEDGKAFNFSCRQTCKKIQNKK